MEGTNVYKDNDMIAQQTGTPRNDIIWTILRQVSPNEVDSLSEEHVQTIIESIENGNELDARVEGGFGFGTEALVEHIVLGVHIALALVHSAMMIKDHHSQNETVMRLRGIAKLLSDRLELTEETIEKLKQVGLPD